MKSKESLDQCVFNIRYDLTIRNRGPVLTMISDSGFCGSIRMSDVAAIEISRVNDKIAYNTAPFARFVLRTIMKNGSMTSYALDGDNMATLMGQYQEIAKQHELPPVHRTEHTDIPRKAPPFIGGEIWDGNSTPTMA